MITNENATICFPSIETASLAFIPQNIVTSASNQTEAFDADDIEHKLAVLYYFVSLTPFTLFSSQIEILESKLCNSLLHPLALSLGLINPPSQESYMSMFSPWLGNSNYSNDSLESLKSLCVGIVVACFSSESLSAINRFFSHNAASLLDRQYLRDIYVRWLEHLYQVIQTTLLSHETTLDHVVQAIIEYTGQSRQLSPVANMINKLEQPISGGFQHFVAQLREVFMVSSYWDIDVLGYYNLICTGK